MKTMNPSTKFISLMIMTFVMAYWHNPVINIAMFVISVVLIIASGTKVSHIALALVPIFLAAFGMFMTGFKYSAGTNMPVKDDLMIIASSNVWNGLVLGSRVLAFAAMGYLFIFTTDRVKMIRSFEQQLKFPQMMAYGLLAAWGIFPQMTQEYRRTIAAFKARGMKVFPVSPSILKPMLVKSVRWSEELAIAMESKGFSGKDKRSTFEPIKVQAKDIIMCIVCIVVFPVVCYLICK